MADPKTGTGKKPKGSGRRLYTDENPRDTVSIKFATPDEIINWFKKNRPKRVETIMGMDISNARDAYSNAKTAFKRSQKGGSVDKPLGAGG